MGGVDTNIPGMGSEAPYTGPALQFREVALSPAQERMKQSDAWKAAFRPLVGSEGSSIPANATQRARLRRPNVVIGPNREALGFTLGRTAVKTDRFEGQTETLDDGTIVTRDRSGNLRTLSPAPKVVPEKLDEATKIKLTALYDIVKDPYADPAEKQAAQNQIAKIEAGLGGGTSGKTGRYAKDTKGRKVTEQADGRWLYDDGTEYAPEA